MISENWVSRRHGLNFGLHGDERSVHYYVEM